jgi:DNA-binding GntR family transcriptional regulator
MIQSIEVAGRIRDEIARGTIAFGEPLRIADLAARYRVSAMPIREALRQLNGEGLITLAPNRTAHVRQVSEQYLRQLFDLHLAVEGVLARAAAASWRATDTKTLLALHQELEAAVACSDAETVLAVNQRFHTFIYERSNNPDAFAAIERHWFLMAALWKHYGYSESRFPGVLNDHWHIIKALDQGDVVGVGFLVGAHVLKARDNILEVVLRRSRNGDE